MTAKVESSTAAATIGHPTVAMGGEHKRATADWLFCRAGSHQFALPVPHVIETMRMLPIKSLAGAPPLVRGLCIIRGKPTPVVDSASMFDDQPTQCERLVTVRTGERTIALAMEKVVGVRAIGAAELQQLPPLLRDVRTMAAMRALDGELVFFLQVARLVPDDVLDRCLAEGISA